MWRDKPPLVREITRRAERLLSAKASVDNIGQVSDIAIDLGISFRTCRRDNPPAFVVIYSG
jgi:hypothetical protein